MRIIAYTFEADMHCPACTGHLAACGLLVRQPPLRMGTDEHGIAYDLVDREGNPVRPVFDIDEDAYTRCGCCGGEL